MVRPLPCRMSRQESLSLDHGLESTRLISQEGQELPVPDATRVDVNKVGASIEADAPRLHLPGRAVQCRQWSAGKANIDGLPKHMQAALGNAVTFSLKFRIGSR